MLRYLLLFSATAYSSAWWPVLPGIAAVLSVLLIFACCTAVFRNAELAAPARDLLALWAGVAWASIWGGFLLAHALPLGLDKSDYHVVGVVAGLPEQSERSTRFVFDVQSLEALSPNAGTEEPPALKRLRLNWYGAPPVEVGQRWQLSVRLRTPRGFVNPGGFDYRLWLLQKGISATGYVRDGERAQLLGDGKGYWLDRYRQRVRDLIGESDFHGPGGRAQVFTTRALLSALAIGDSGDLSRQTWATLRQTGTIHLMIISGLHLGMAAAFGMALGALLGRGMCLLGSPIPARQVGAVLGLLLALVYGAMAGFTLPTQRATVMVAVFLLAMLQKRALRPWLAFSWALALQALIDPLAVLSPGFWLSYGAVAAFIAYFSGYPQVGRLNYHQWQGAQERPSRFSAIRFWLAGRVSPWVVGLLRAQWVVLLILSGALLYFQGAVSLLAPLINLVAIPWFSLGVVPLVLLGVMSSSLSEALALCFWQGAVWQLQAFTDLLNTARPYAEQLQWHVVTDRPLLIGLTSLAAGLLLLAPRGLGFRTFAFLLLCAVIRVEPPKGSLLEVTVLDVGQGLSVVVSSRDKVLVYDVGSKFSERFDIGSAVLAPYLRYRGINRIDTLVVSHNDLDHAGGLDGLLETVAVDRVLAGQPEQLSVDAAQQCEAGMSWRWEALEFTVLHPGSFATGGLSKQSDNDRSCVLSIRLGEQKILLTGDIEADVERALLQEGALVSDLSLLLAPHHGSRTSSSPGFVTRVSPDHVVYSAGFNHHFGHPHVRVVERYAAVGAQQWSTAESGALIFVWRDRQNLQIDRTRDSLSRYWHAPIRAPL